MNIHENYSLKKLNTFGIEAFARYYTEFASLEELLELLDTQQFKNTSLMVLGGGSNILFTKNFNGIVLKNELKGIQLIKQDEEFYYIKAAAGENWHHLVMHCVENSYAGIENLSLIPGSVGAGPIQNIGAYGVELKDVLYELEALNLNTKHIETFTNSDCRFGYRNSVFKQEEKNKYVIVSVTLQLRKKPVFNINYGAIEKELEAMNVKELSIASISKAVCAIRSSKLPDPSKTGNAGSFFKNPTVSTEKYEVLKKDFPSIAGYKSSDKDVKLAAGWLIEQCGWKGKRLGDAGVHKDQALVIVNYGNATGNEIYDLSGKILESVKEKFDVVLEREVNIL